MKTIAFFNNKGGVGKTTLIYHIAWMLHELGIRVVVADLDPQSNLTATFLDESVVEGLWDPNRGPRHTVFGAIAPLIEGTGDITNVPLQSIAEYLHLIPGDLQLSSLEQEFSAQWPNCMDGQVRAFRVESALTRLISEAVQHANAQFCLVDVGPNLGAINRAALIACDQVVVPLGPDLFSLQGLRNLGPALHSWRTGWADRKSRNPDPENIQLADGSMTPIGYVVLQHGQRSGRPVAAYDRWMRRIPAEYRRSLTSADEIAPASVEDDPNCLGLLRHYHSLIPLAQEARKPIFLLRSADGALGAHQNAVASAFRDFRKLTRSIVNASASNLPPA